MKLCVTSVLHGVPYVKARKEELCGLAAVEMVMRYYHPDLKLSQVQMSKALSAHARPGEAPGLDELSEFLHEYMGVANEAVAYGADLSQILHSISDGIPPIVNIKVGAGAHTVVIVGFETDKWIYYLDPMKEGYDGLSTSVALKGFVVMWDKGVLMVKDDVADPYRFSKGLLIRHLRDKHHGYQRKTETCH